MYALGIEPSPLDGQPVLLVAETPLQVTSTLLIILHGYILLRLVH